jgi:erythromycin esterase-like protein
MIDAVTKIREKAINLKGASDAADEILKLIGNAQFVLLGEASHGTREFYQSRAEITKRLIREKDFCAVAVEADFPDAYRVNRFVYGSGEDKTALNALSNFRKYPLWMWRNQEVLRFIEWLRAHNDAQREAQKKIGFYGLDLYSLHASMEAVLSYLSKVDPEAAQRARYRYSCFEDFGEDPQSYGYAASFDLKHSCEDEAVKQLVELQRRSAEYTGSGDEGALARDEYFFAEQNARLVKNAEEYYRQMFHRNVSSWNLRDKHMAESLSAIAKYLENQGQTGKIVVWAHNSHLGDASATDMAKRGEWNLGQLAREEYGREAVRIIGFTTFTGTVTATDNWNEPAQLKRVRPALPESCENLFHRTEIENFFLNLRDAGDQLRQVIFGKSILQRAIGVIYRPQSERVSHYFQTHLPQQFDGVLHFDETRAVTPLDNDAGWKTGDTEDAPETFPSGL